MNKCGNCGEDVKAIYEHQHGGDGFKCLAVEFIPSTGVTRCVKCKANVLYEQERWWHDSQSPMSLDCAIG